MMKTNSLTKILMITSVVKDDLNQYKEIYIIKIKILCYFCFLLDSKLTSNIQLRVIVSNVARSLGVVRRAGELYDCPRVFKSCSNEHVLSTLKYCAPVWISFAEFHLGLLDSVVRSAEKLYDGELCGFGTEGSLALCLLYKIYHRVDHPMNKNLHYFFRS